MVYLSHLYKKQILAESSYGLAFGHRRDRIPARNDVGAFSCVLIIRPPSAVTGERAASFPQRDLSQMDHLICGVCVCVCGGGCVRNATLGVCAGGSCAAAGRFHMTS